MNLFVLEYLMIATVMPFVMISETVALMLLKYAQVRQK